MLDRLVRNAIVGLWLALFVLPPDGEAQIWTQKSPGSVPPGRHRHVMAFDAARGVVVLHGGLATNDSPVLDDTWTWNGNNWTQKSPTSKPSARREHAMAYDAARSQIVIFGGDPAGAAAVNDETWTWDGTTWTLKAPTSKPSGRTGHAMAYDTARSEVVLFGGNDNTADLNDTWTWNGTNWTQKSPATRPSIRDSAVMAFDENLSAVVLYGGGVVADRNETWKWTGTNWVKLTPTASPSAGRARHAAAFDTFRDLFVMFAGNDAVDDDQLVDTWEFNGTTWTERSPATLPPQRDNHAMAYDSARGAVVCFGGKSGASTWLSDTWEYRPTPAALSITSLAATPVTVSRGQTGVTVTMVVANTGNTTASITSSSPKFFSGATDKTSDYTINSSGNPATITAASSGTFTYTVDVGNSATTGNITIDGSVAGTDLFLGTATSDSSAGATDSWTVQTAATLTIGAIAATPVTVSRGQTGIAVTMQVANTGQATANVAASSLTFTGTASRTSEYTVTPGSNPTTITGGVTETFSYTVVVGGSATAELITLDGTVSGSDANSGSALSDAAAATTDSWTVQTAATLAIQTIAATPTLVSRGQSGIAVAMTVANTGQATANVSGRSLTFTGTAGRTSEYTVVQGSGPSTIPGNDSAVYNFTVSVGVTATAESIVLDGSVTGADANSLTSISDSSSALTDTWTVQTPATLAIRTISVVPTTVIRGQTGIAVTMTVENTGQAIANVTASGLTFSGSADRTSQYTVTPGSNPATITGGVTATFSYTVDVTSTATAETITLNGTVSGTDANSGAVTSDDAADTTDQWNTVRPPGLNIIRVETGPATVSRAQGGIAVAMTVENTGQNSANITATGLTFTGTASRTSEYTVSPGSGPVSITAGATATYSFQVTVGASATPEAITIDGTVSGIDTATSTALSDTTADFTAGWTVQIPAALAIRTIATAPQTVSRGQTGIAVTMIVENTGGASATIAAAGLTFTGVANRTAEYTASTVASPPAISGGATATYSFTVGVSPTASVEAITINGSVSGSDANSAAALADVTADTTDSWTVQIASTLAIRAVTATPVTVSRGQTSIAVSMTVQNTGQASATVSAAGLTFTGTADRGSDYQVLAVASPASIAGGVTATYSFTVDVSPTASLEVVTLNGMVSGIDSNTGQAVSDSAADATFSWAVQAPAQLAVRSVSTVPLRVTRGQSGIAVSMQVQNPGGAVANVSSAGLTFTGLSDRAADYTVTSVSAPLTVAGGITQTYTFAVTVTPTAALGTIVLGGAVLGSDANTAAALSDPTADITDSWQVQTPAALSIGAVALSTQTVNRGQRGLRIELPVTNDGQADAQLNSGTVRFLRAGGVTLSSEYTVVAAANASSVSGGATVVLTFAADITATATLGAVTIDGSVAGTDGPSGRTVSDAEAAAAGQWTVLEPAVLSVESLVADAGSVAQAETGVPVRMTLRNSGQAPAGISSVQIRFLASGGSDVTTQFIVQAVPGGVKTVPGAGSVTLDFTVSVLRGAERGLVTLSSAVTGVDRVDARALTPAPATDTWTVLALPELAIARTEAAPEVVRPGDIGLAVSVLVENSGDLTSTVLQPLLKFRTADREWARRQPVAAPAPRSASAVVYDEARGVAVLFGGRDSASQPLGDTWEWDGSAWRSIAPASAPPARFGHGLAFDSARGRTVLFGGFDNRTLLSDTWEWSGTLWEKRQLATGPVARQLHALAFDKRRGRVVLFGGAGRTLAPVEAGVWEWDGTAWAVQAGATGPVARHSHAMAFDAARGRTLLFGGFGGSDALGDTWEWDGSRWAGRIPAASPAARFAHAMAYDASRRTVTLVGGVPRNNLAISLPDTHEWDGTSWRPIFEPRTLEERGPRSPGGRSSHSVAYDNRREQLLLFGGLEASRSGPGEFLIGQAPGASDSFEKRPTDQTWELGFGDRTGDYTIRPRGGAFVTGLSNHAFVFDVDVRATASAGVAVLDARLEGNGPGQARQPDRWLVHRAALLSILRVDAPAAEISPGQGGLAVTMSVSNSGGSTALVDLARTGLTFNGSTVGYSVTTAGPASIQAGATGLYRFTIAATPGLPAGSVTIDGRIAATDAFTGDAVGATGAGQVDSWRVLTPSVLSIRSVSAAPERIVRGQRGIVVTMAVANTGLTTVEFDLGRSGLTFNGSAEGYSVTTAGPARIPASSAATCTFTVDVQAGATLGNTVVDGVVAGVDALTRAPLLVRGGGAFDRWTVLTPAALALRAVTAPRERIVVGERRLAVTLSVENLGQSTAVIAAGGAGLTFNGSRVGYAVTTAPAARIEGGDRITFAFEVDAGPDAARGSTGIDGRIDATDVASGASSGREGADTADSWVVLSPAKLVIVSVASAATIVRAGQRGIPVTMTVENEGESEARIGSAALRFRSAEPVWRLAAPATSPPARSSHAMASDSARGRIVLFGGFDGTDRQGDTWEWDGSSWSNLLPASSPTGRTGHAMAYDGARGRVVLFGGDDGGGRLADTWEWDGTRWSAHRPAVAPPARSGHALAYDPLRRRVVLFGGDTGSAKRSDTWEWDGTRWGLRAPVTSPPGRSGHAMAADSATGRLVLFGGIDGLGRRFEDTWLWDGDRWRSAAPARSPSARLQHAMAFDDTRGRLVLFGGQDTNGVALADSWEWNGVSWTQPSLGTAPPPRLAFAMAHDSASGRLLLFGGAGATGDRLNDTWRLTSANRGASYRAVRASPSPESIPGLGRAVLEFLVDVVDAPSTGRVVLDGSVVAFDSVSGAPAGASGAGLDHEWSTFLTRARLAIRTVTASRSQVRRGQPGVRVVMSVANTGSTTANVQLGATGLAFGAGQSGFTVATNGSAAIRGNRTADYVLSVDVGETAPLGSTILDGFIGATDAIDGGSVSTAGAAVTTAWEVLERVPATLALRAITTAKTRVTRGQKAIKVTLSLENTGSNTAVVDLLNSRLLFGGSAGGYIQSLAGPARVPGGASAVYTATVEVGAAAKLGTVVLTGVFAAKDALSGLAAVVQTADAQAAWTVLTPAVLAIRSVAPEKRKLLPGQRALPVLVSIANTGGTTAVLAAGQPRLILDAALSATADATGPAEIPGDSTATYRFEVSAGLDAAAGETRLHATISSRDVNTRATVADRTGDSLAAVWTVLEGARLLADGIAGSETARRDDGFIVFAIRLANVGEASADLDLPAMERAFSSSSFLATIAGPDRIAAGKIDTCTVTLTFTSRLVPGVFATVRGRVPYSDAVVPERTASLALVLPRFEIQTARARLRVASVTPSLPSVARGQKAAKVALKVANDGGTTADVDLTRTALRFTPGAASYSATLGGPFEIPAAATVTYSFLVNVGLDAPLGSTQIDGGVVARDTLSREAVGDSKADSPGTWTVLAPAALSIASVQVATAVVRRGDVAIPATVIVTNTGQAAARIDLRASGLTFGGRREGYSVLGTGPAQVAAGVTASYTFSVGVGGSAPLGSTTIDAIVLGTDSITGAAVSDRGADLTTSFSVLAATAGTVLPRAVLVAPKAKGGPRTFNLSAAGSTGNALAYSWTLVTRPGNAAAFSFSGPTPQYSARIAGEYVFSLTVSDSAGRSDTALATLAVSNQKPMASAGKDRSIVLFRPGFTAPIQMRRTLQLDASASSDANEDPLTYAWTIVLAPKPHAASPDQSTAAEFSSRSVARPVLEFSDRFRSGADPATGPLLASGAYRFQVAVSDGTETTTSVVDVDAIDPRNLLPVAQAGRNRRVRTVFTGTNPAPILVDPLLKKPNNLVDYVRLDGRESSEPEGKKLEYAWRLLDAPAGGATNLLQRSSPTPTFIPRRAGLYAAELVVSRGELESAPDRVEIVVEDENHAPTASVVVRNATGSIRSSRAVPTPEFTSSDSVRLDADDTVDVDPGDRATLGFLWSVIKSPPGIPDYGVDDVEQDVTRFRARPGAYRVRLVVSDRVGGEDSGEVGLKISKAKSKSGAVDAKFTGAGDWSTWFAADGSDFPSVSLVSSATTVSRRGEELPEAAGPVAVNSLRVSLPTTVTLSAFVTTPTTAGDRYNFSWRQAAGPPVLLSSPVQSLTTQTTAATSFSPTTCGVHLFELTLDKLDENGEETGFSAEKRIRVVVDSPGCSVPTAKALSAQATIPLTGSESERTVTLDGSSSSAAPGETLQYDWKQIDGPRGVLEDEFEPVARFSASALPGTTSQRELLFELNVRSVSTNLAGEPALVVVRQAPAAAPAAPDPAVTGLGGRTGGGGGGCGLAGAGNSAESIVPMLLPFVGLLVSRRRRPHRTSRAAEKMCSFVAGAAWGVVARSRVDVWRRYFHYWTVYGILVAMFQRHFRDPGGSYFLFGPRGTGKSTWLRRTYPRALFVDLLEHDVFRAHAARPERLREVVQAAPAGCPIVIDEVQKVPELLGVVHALIERDRRRRFILTGSSARKLKRSGVDLLAGRALLRTMHPLMAAEMGRAFDLDRALSQGLLPIVVDSANPAETLKSYAALYVREEVQMEGLVRRVGDFARFLEAVSFSHAALLNCSNVARECEVGRKTVEAYVQVLEDLLLAFRLPVFEKRARRAVAQHPKLYLADVGLFRSLRPAGPLDRPEEIEGAAVEGLVAQHLRAWRDYGASDCDLYFWRTPSGSEVDFVVYGKSGFWAIEVKRANRVRPEDLRSLKTFHADYPECRPLFLYLGQERLERDGIHCLPCSEFLMQLVPGQPLLRD